MEQTKLTVRVPRGLLDGAKRYAREHNTSLTRLVSAYLRQLNEPSDHLAQAPTVRRLSGILSPDALVADYHAYLEEKYGIPAPGSD
jgi:hypothetical protein